MPALADLSQTLASGYSGTYKNLMFCFARVFTLFLVLAFSASSIAGPVATTSMNIAMAVSTNSFDTSDNMKDCADQRASKAAMMNCDLVCSAPAASVFGAGAGVVFSEAVITVVHLLVDVQADSLTLVCNGPPPRSLILI